MTKLTMLLALAACGGSAAPGSTSPGSTSAMTTPSNPATGDEAGSADDTRLPPDQYPPRKQQLLRTPAELAWQDAPQAKGVSTAGAWGDPSKEGGWFIKLAKGAATQQTYAVDARGVVVTGTLESSTKPAPNGRSGTLITGFTWFQPANTPRTLRCVSGECLVFVETMGSTDDGAATEKRAGVLTLPPIDVTETTPMSVITIWGFPETPSREVGMLMLLQPGRGTGWHVHRHDYHGVVLAGTVDNRESGRESKDLPVGSYYFQPGGFKHTTSCKADGPKCLVYVHFMGPYDSTRSD